MVASKAGASGESREGNDSVIFSSKGVSGGETDKISTASVLRFGGRRLGSRRRSR